MASSIIHMCIAKEINKTLKFKDENTLLLGSIAPDISKHIGQPKTQSHFLIGNNKINIQLFLNKYKDKMKKQPFVMGYFIHLYTDLLWDKYFMSDIVKKGTIQLLDGKVVKNNPETYRDLIYQDYTNLNTLLISQYHLDLSLFYMKAVIPNIEMDEIPVKQLYRLLEHTKLILTNAKQSKSYTFNLENVIPFIEISSHLILSVIQDII